MNARNVGRGASAGQGDSNTGHSGTTGPLTLAQVARRHRRHHGHHGQDHHREGRHVHQEGPVQGAVLVTVADAGAWAAAFPLTAGRALHG